MRTASYAVLSRDVLCCATVLCCAVLCCAVALWFVVSYCAVFKAVPCRAVACLVLLSCPTVARLAPASQCAPRLNLFSTIHYSNVVSVCKSQVKVATAGLPRAPSCFLPCSFFTSLFCYSSAGFFYLRHRILWRNRKEVWRWWKGTNNSLLHTSRARKSQVIAVRPITAVLNDPASPFIC
jgi:hypothetical protein